MAWANDQGGSDLSTFRRKQEMHQFLEDRARGIGAGAGAAAGSSAAPGMAAPIAAVGSRANPNDTSEVAQKAQDQQKYGDLYGDDQPQGKIPLAKPVSTVADRMRKPRPYLNGGV